MSKPIVIHWQWLFCVRFKPPKVDLTYHHLYLKEKVSTTTSNQQSWWMVLGSGCRSWCAPRPQRAQPHEATAVTTTDTIYQATLGTNVSANGYFRTSRQAATGSDSVNSFHPRMWSMDSIGAVKAQRGPSSPRERLRSLATVIHQDCPYIAYDCRAE
jgi:hypothetical protein